MTWTQPPGGYWTEWADGPVVTVHADAQHRPVFYAFRFYENGIGLNGGTDWGNALAMWGPKVASTSTLGTPLNGRYLSVSADTPWLGLWNMQRVVASLYPPDQYAGYYFLHRLEYAPDILIMPDCPGSIAGIYAASPPIYATGIEWEGFVPRDTSDVTNPGSTRLNLDVDLIATPSGEGVSWPPGQPTTIPAGTVEVYLSKGTLPIPYPYDDEIQARTGGGVIHEFSGAGSYSFPVGLLGYTPDDVPMIVLRIKDGSLPLPPPLSFSPSSPPTDSPVELVQAWGLSVDVAVAGAYRIPRHRFYVVPPAAPPIAGRQGWTRANFD